MAEDKKTTSMNKSSVMDDHSIKNLTDLVASDFFVSPKDKDFSLDKEGLVKVCKILLHKVNHNFFKNDEKAVMVEQNLVKEIETSERSVKSSMEEVNQFLQSVHGDFESFLKRHNRERADTNLKIQKLSEVAHKTLDNYDQISTPITTYATMLTCMLEFNWIQQSLTMNSL